MFARKLLTSSPSLPTRGAGIFQRRSWVSGSTTASPSSSAASESTLDVVASRGGQKYRKQMGRGRSGNEDGPIHDEPDWKFVGKKRDLFRDEISRV